MPIMEMLLHKRRFLPLNLVRTIFLGNAHFQGNPFIFPNYFLALHVPLWNRHNERRLLRFGFDDLKT